MPAEGKSASMPGIPFPTISSKLYFSLQRKGLLFAGNVSPLKRMIYLLLSRTLISIRSHVRTLDLMFYHSCSLPQGCLAFADSHRLDHVGATCASRLRLDHRIATFSCSFDAQHRHFTTTAPQTSPCLQQRNPLESASCPLRVLSFQRTVSLRLPN